MVCLLDCRGVLSYEIDGVHPFFCVFLYRLCDFLTNFNEKNRKKKIDIYRVSDSEEC
jgi:hypothetical protein